MVKFVLDLIEDGKFKDRYSTPPLFQDVHYMRLDSFVNDDPWMDILGISRLSAAFKQAPNTVCFNFVQPEEPQYATKGLGGCHNNYLLGLHIPQTTSVFDHWKVYWNDRLWNPNYNKRTGDLELSDVCPPELKNSLLHNTNTQMLHQLLINVTEKLSPTMCNNSDDHNLYHTDNQLLQQEQGEPLVFPSDKFIDISLMQNDAVERNGILLIRSMAAQFATIIDHCTGTNMTVPEEAFTLHYPTLKPADLGDEAVRFLYKSSPSLDNGVFDGPCGNSFYNGMHRAIIEGCKDFIFKTWDQAKFEKAFAILEPKISPDYCNAFSPKQNVQGEPVFKYKIEINSEAFEKLLAARNNAANFPVNQNSSNLNFGHATNTTVVDIAADHSGSGNMKLHELINNATTEFATNFLSAGNNAANFPVNQNSSNLNFGHATNTTVVDIAADHSGSGNMKLHELINNATTEFATNFLSAGNNAANFSVNQDSSHFNLSNATNTTVVDIAADHSGSGNMKLHELINNATTEFATNFLSAGNNADQSNLSKPPLSLSQVNGAVYNNIEPSESSDVRTTVIGVMGIVAGAAIVVVAGSFVMSKVKNAVKSWYYNDKNQNVSSGQNHSPTLQSAHNSKQVIPMNFIIKNDSGRLEEFDAVTNSDSEQIPPSKITHVSNSLVNSELQQNVSCA